MSVALLTDRYELTMLQAALRDGTAQRQCVFETFARRLPPGRRYGIVAGTGRLAELLASFRFDRDDGSLDYLLQAGVIDDDTAAWLADFRFGGTIRGYAEGECFFPDSPVLTVEGSFAECVLLETLVLSVLNHDCAVAGAASRMTAAAVGRPCLEMGARRTHEQAAVAAARAAFVAGFAGSSCLEAGRRWGVPTIGTAAHAFTLVHDSEQAAFASQVASMGVGTTLLLDTYDVAKAVERAVAVAGVDLAAVRIDSGDLTMLAGQVRQLLDSLGAKQTKIVVTSDLDEYAIAALAIAPVDTYGVGTRLVTGSGAPTAELVYKLVAREGANGQLEAVAKTFGGKSSVGGAKWAGRRLDDSGQAVEEIVTVLPPGTAPPTNGDIRPLQVTYVNAGQIDPVWTGQDGLQRARQRHLVSRDELPLHATRLSQGEPVIPTLVNHG
ncbi:MAG: nicotinate phosphoribosyltransferase [Micrococcales bacterium]|nr:nicotinate phosphoribosyltransferase [Micrococcales bacterium]